MSEKKLVIDQLKFRYEGIFDMEGLYRLIDSFFYEKGYDKREREIAEQVFPHGKEVELETHPYKNLTDYFRIVVKIRLTADGLKKVDVERDGVKVPLMEGEITMVIDGYLVSDRAGKWNRTPFQWFLRVLFDKYFFKGHFLKAEQWLASDVDDFYKRIQAFLNTYRGVERDIIATHVL